jgi:hypothetical protein
MNMWYVIGAIAIAVAATSVLLFTSYSVSESSQLSDVYIMQFEPNVPGVDISLEVGPVITVSITNNLEESITAIFYEEMILLTGESSQVTIEGESKIEVLPGKHDRSVPLQEEPSVSSICH